MTATDKARESAVFTSIPAWRSGIAIALLSLATPLTYGQSATSAQNDFAVAEGGQKRVIVEKVPSAEIRNKLTSLFQQARSIQILHTPERDMGRLGFNEKRARDLAKYKLTVDCGERCQGEFLRFQSVLGKGLKLDGSCPNSVSTVVSFIDATGSELDSLFITSEGQCFQFETHGHFLADPVMLRLLNNLTEISD